MYTGERSNIPRKNFNTEFAKIRDGRQNVVKNLPFSNVNLYRVYICRKVSKTMATV